MITIVKLGPQGEEKIRYHGELIEGSADRAVIRAVWTLPPRDLGYTRFEPGDQFVEYYYTDRWFNIFAIASTDHTRKGWYCNIAEPAQLAGDTIKQIDLLLDVWINPQGEPLILDEDEFTADTTLSERQRSGARQGLQALLSLLETRQEPFAALARNLK